MDLLGQSDQLWLRWGSDGGEKHSRHKKQAVRRPRGSHGYPPFWGTEETRGCWRVEEGARKEMSRKGGQRPGWEMWIFTEVLSKPAEGVSGASASGIHHRHLG